MSRRCRISWRYAGGGRVCCWQNEPHRGTATSDAGDRSTFPGRRHEGVESGLEHRRDISFRRPGSCDPGTTNWERLSLLPYRKWEYGGRPRFLALSTSIFETRTKLWLADPARF